MPEEISVQILSQTSENIQKLFDLSTRIDERVKSIQSKQEQIENRIEGVQQQQVTMMQKVAVLEAKKDSSEDLRDMIEETQGALVDLDKRLARLENEHDRHNDRWGKIASFVIQMVWVILAAYLLTKFNLQAPAVP